MVQTPNTEGICQTCIYHEGCLARRNSLKMGKPVLHCEEFDDSAIAMEKDSESRPLPKSYATLPGYCIKNVIPG